MTGKLITFEGPDGAGKTSAIQGVIAQLPKAVKDKLVITREPGGNEISEKIRQIILDINHDTMDSRTEALLYAAARRQHIVETILPALAANKIVFCDRFVDSSLAYQGAGRQIGVEAVARMNEFATEGLTPDLTLYFDVPPAVGLQRIAAKRTTDYDRLEKEALAFHQKVFEAYQQLILADPKRIKRIDATQTPQQVVTQALTLLKPLMTTDNEI